VTLLACIYFGTAKLGLSFSPVAGFATVVWPPTGIALATLWLFGWRLWPGVFIGAFTINFTTGATVSVALGLALGNTLEAVVGVYLLKRFGLQSRLPRIRDVALLIGCAALLSTAVSATIGTSSLLVGGTITAGAYPKTWITWWVGDILGDLIVAPLLLLWAARQPIHLWSKQFREAAIVAILFLTSAGIIFGNVFTTAASPISYVYLLLPFLIWAALRFRARYVVTLVFALSVLAVWATAHNHGPFVRGTTRENLTSLQLFMGVTSVTFLSLATVTTERSQALAAVAALNKKLEGKVAAKTAELHQKKELERLKDEFVAIASHELKTPLTSMKAYAQVLEKTFARSQDKHAADLAASIDRQADKLTA